MLVTKNILKSGIFLESFLVVVFILLYTEENLLTYLLKTSIIFVLAFKRKVFQESQFWLFLTFTWGLNLSLSWRRAENHDFLFFYILVSIYLSVKKLNSKYFLQRSSRVLLAILFFVAFAQKLSSSEFHSGSFLITTYTFDSRVVNIFPRIFGLSYPDYNTNQDAIEAMKEISGELSFSVNQPDSFSLFGLITTYWTLFIELVIALSFITSVFRGFRDYILQLFIFTSYLIIPISGFGLLLCLLGLMQAPTSKHKLGYLYGVVFVILVGAL
jgi:hypothetical protein